MSGTFSFIPRKVFHVQVKLNIISALLRPLAKEEELRKNVKRVIEVIVGLLKDRADVEKEPALKKQRVRGYFEKQE